jgi:hypothetical protein
MEAIYGGSFVDGSGNAVTNATAIYDSIEAETLYQAEIATKYWNIIGDVISEMSQGEKDIIDTNEASQLVSDNRLLAVDEIEANDGAGFINRELIELFNKRDNYIINRIEELQTAFDDVKATSGPADNIRAAIPSSWLATATRSRRDTVIVYKNDIDNGVVDIGAIVNKTLSDLLNISDALVQE